MKFENTILNYYYYKYKLQKILIVNIYDVGTIHESYKAKSAVFTTD